ncbi:MAG: sugar ABC transporter ATP-binding protein, partial [Acetobacteraceae bacterium]|nr:sugar ABC transporter ATP-binding protein [Acetobacteraceae bacterium]
MLVSRAMMRHEGELGMEAAGDHRSAGAPAALRCLPSAGDILLDVRALSKQFGGVRALDGVSLDVRRGEIHALLGENGAGKSTLIKVIAGAIQPTAGGMAVHGHPAQFAGPPDAQRAGIAVVHQHYNLVASLSVQENLWLGQRLPRRAGILVDWPRVRRQARAWLDRVALAVDPGRIVSELRPDERAMVSLARAIASDAQLIVLDEPTASLLQHEVGTLFAQMRRLAAFGHAFLYVSHRLAEVLEIADRATVLRDGRNAGTFRRDEMDHRTVVAAIVGPGKALDEQRPPSAMTAEITLEVEALRGPHVAGVGFALRRGEILGLAGLPASGAEETLHLLFGRAAAAGGRIRLNGREIALRSPRDAVAAGIALVPSDRLAEAVIARHSVRENISLVSLARYRRDPVLGFINRRREAAAVRDLTRRLAIRMPGLEAPIEAL